MEIRLTKYSNGFVTISDENNEVKNIVTSDFHACVKDGVIELYGNGKLLQTEPWKEIKDETGTALGTTQNEVVTALTANFFF